MRLAHAIVALLASALLSGCGYIHFGRLEKAAVGGSDAALATAYSNLSTEHKILKQELALARREGDTLRVALERGSGAPTADATARLSEANRELAALRASYARLQAERAGGTKAATDAPRFRELEEKLATSLRDSTQLREENARLRGELDRTRTENLALGAQLKAAASQGEQAKQAVEMLNGELLAQKQARARAEQATEAMRAQLNLVLARNTGAPAGPGTLADARESTAASTASLQLSRPPTGDAAPTAELRADTERLRRASGAAAPDSAAPPRPAAHVVQPGDTLEKIAIKHYGAAERWRTIYEANQALLGGGQPLRVGMELQLP